MFIKLNLDVQNVSKRGWFPNEGNVRDADSIPGLRRSPGGKHGNPLQNSYLENSMDRGAWHAAVHGAAKSQTRLSNFTFTFHFHALEKEMATNSSVLAWRIPGMGEPGGLPSMGLHRVGHNWSDSAAAAAGHIIILWTTSTTLAISQMLGKYLLFDHVIRH